MTTADVLREVVGLEKIRDPFLLWKALQDSEPRVAAFWRALYCTAGDFVEYYVSRVDTSDLTALLDSAVVRRSKEKTAATEREIRRRARR